MFIGRFLSTFDGRFRDCGSWRRRGARASQQIVSSLSFLTSAISTNQLFNSEEEEGEPVELESSSCTKNTEFVVAVLGSGQVFG